MRDLRWRLLAILVVAMAVGINPMLGCDDGGDGDADADTDVDADSDADSDGGVEMVCRDLVQAVLDCLHDYCQGRGTGTYYCDICEPRGLPNSLLSSCGCDRFEARSVLQGSCESDGPEFFASSTACPTVMDNADSVEERCFGANSCPINSGYPCACNNVDGTCIDGSLCVAISAGDTVGYCSASCPGVGSDANCSTLWGVQYDHDGDIYGGLCYLSTNVPDIADHCVIVCEDAATSTTLYGPCPPGLECIAAPSGPLSTCQ